MSDAPHGNIRILATLVADQIAAGEVVERPASVAKELLENSIDAGATNIQLDIESGGVKRVRVFDNGSGMSPQDLPTAFIRHATSKISALEDLDDIHTCGFRGEALPAIASVSKLCIRTRTEGQISGIELCAEGGLLRAPKEAGCPVGTDIEVRDLFFNTPARLKFLKAEGTEGGHCAEALVRLALMRPHIAFKMTANGRTVRAYHRTQSVAERLHHVFPGEALGKAQGTELGVEVLALLTAPEKARPGAGNLYAYVNGRFVRDRALLRAVSQAFGGTLGAGRYPSGLVALTLPPGSFDINVHPQKTEVRFSDPQAVFRAVSRVVGTMVARTIWSQMPQRADAPAPHQPSDVPVPRPFTSAAHTAEPRTSATATHSAPRPFPAPAPSAPRPFPAPGPQPAAPAARTPQQTTLPASGAHDPKAHPYSRLPYLGQAQGTFLLFDDTDDLVFIDQHAAHERVTYERLRQQHQQGQVQTQRLLMPQHVDLGPAEADRILSMAPELERLGLTVEASGPERVAIRAVPAALGNAAPDRLLADMVLALEEHRAGSKGETDDHALATMACHASIRAGKILTADEVHALLRAMDAIDFAGHCPHGRPVAFRIPWSEIRRRVQRT